MTLHNCAHARTHTRYHFNHIYKHVNIPKLLPNKVNDDEELSHTVDNSHRPALDHHRLGRLIGEETSDPAKHDEVSW